MTVDDDRWWQMMQYIKWSMIDDDERWYMRDDRGWKW